MEGASGKQEHVVAVNIDIRGFSAFCTAVESPDVALFVRNVYKKLIDRYFPDAPFIKPTGDGLLIVIPITPYTDKNLKKTAANTIETCLKALEAFGSFCDEDLTIYFKKRVPRRIGIGLSMGSACRLVSDDKTLDYSGSPLNLASRLMEAARPSGIVLDASLGATIPDDLKELFSKGSIFLYGIAEREPVEVYYTKEYTRIPQTYKQRLDFRKWRTSEATPIRLEQIELMDAKGQDLVLTLDSKPVDPDHISVEVHFPEPIRVKRGVGSTLFYDFEYSFEGGEPLVVVDSGKLVKTLREYGFDKNHEAKLISKFPI